MCGLTALQPPPWFSSLVQFKDVRKTYDGDNLVVKTLNLDICEGEFLTMLSPSGSGKTTSLMVLARFEVPPHGDILLAGTSLKSPPPRDYAYGEGTGDRFYPRSIKRRCLRVDPAP